MAFVMTAAPIAMVGHGHSIDHAALGIQWHVLAMFAPSFVTGYLIARFGKERVTAAGLLLIAVSAAVALSGLDIPHFWASLIVLGVGWNFGFIGATAMVDRLSYAGGAQQGAGRQRLHHVRHRRCGLVLLGKPAALVRLGDHQLDDLPRRRARAGPADVARRDERTKRAGRVSTDRSYAGGRKLFSDFESSS